ACPGGPRVLFCATPIGCPARLAHPDFVRPRVVGLMQDGKSKSAEATPNTPRQELVRERLRSVHLINRLRVWAVSLLFALFLLLGGLRQMPAWMGNHRLFAVYWVITVAVLYWSRFERYALWTGVAIPLLDMPMVFFLQQATLWTSPSASGVAGFTVGFYV